MSAALDPAVAPVVAAEAVESALAEIRPHLHGDIELVAIIGNEVQIRLGGTCTDCAMRAITLRTGVERVLRARVPGIALVTAV